MIQQIAKDNEAVTPITREMEGLKEYFPQCFNSKIDQVGRSVDQGTVL